MSQKNDGKDEKGALRVDQSSLMNKEGFSFSGYERDLLYLSMLGEGKKKFMDISGVSGIDSITDGRAGVFADFDNDGDLDVFMTTIQNDAHLLFRNNVGQDRNFLRVELEGKKMKDAFSSVVRVKTSRGIQTKIKDGGSGFISQHDSRLLFGLGADEQVSSIEVAWANGAREVFNAAVKANSTIKLKEGTGAVESINLAKANLPEPLSRAASFARNLKVNIGQPMPDIQVNTLDGKPVSLRSQLQKNRRTLINVWATWCVPCAQEMPELERLQNDLKRRGIDLIGMNVDINEDAPTLPPLAQVKTYLQKRGITYANLIGGVPFVENTFLGDELAVPLSILVDEKGNVIEIIPGWSAETRARLDRLAK